MPKITLGAPVVVAVVVVHDRDIASNSQVTLLPRALVSCPLWVKSRRQRVSDQCPLYPRKRTWFGVIVMSALCQKQTSVRFGWRQRQEAGRPAEYHRVAKHTRPPQRQGDLRRVIVVDVRDGGERNKLNVSLPIS